MDRLLPLRWLDLQGNMPPFSCAHAALDGYFICSKLFWDSKLGLVWGTQTPIMIPNSVNICILCLFLASCSHMACGTPMKAVAETLAIYTILLANNMGLEA